MASKPRTPSLNLATQAAYLRIRFPLAKAEIRRSCLNWRCVLQPTELSMQYEVSMEYSLETRPKVRVLAPTLEFPEFKYEVHTYPDGTLCLYFPGEWSRGSLLVDTVVPWICEWLAHYEVWQVTGKWLGGGVHPGGKADKPEVA